MKGSPANALRSALAAGAEELLLPCDVRLPPALQIAAGCKLGTLLEALAHRAEEGISRFPHPAPSTKAVR